MPTATPALQETRALLALLQGQEPGPFPGHARPVGSLEKGKVRGTTRQKMGPWEELQWGADGCIGAGCHGSMS